jgi:hypothetical protein
MFGYTRPRQTRGINPSPRHYCLPASSGRTCHYSLTHLCHSSSWRSASSFPSRVGPADGDWQLQSELKVEAEMEVNLDGYYPRTPLRSIAQLGRISCQEDPEQLAYAAYSECLQR